MPISNICKASDVPPELKNGSDIPVFGIEFVTTAILSAACIPIFITSPTAASAPKVFSTLIAIFTPRQTNKENKTITASAPRKPSSSHIMAKTKSFCGCDTYPNFCRLLKIPRPKKPPEPMA